MKRQAATPKGLERRIRDLNFAQVPDPRMASKVIHRIPNVMTALVAGMVTNARSLRSVEQRSGEIAKKHGAWQGVKERIADNTLGRLLPRLRLVALLACLHRLIKVEQRRGNLKPTVLPIPTVAIDGKNVDEGLGYFAQIKSIHGELYAEAVRRLGARRPSRAPQSYSDQQNGKNWLQPGDAHLGSGHPALPAGAL